MTQYHIIELQYLLTAILSSSACDSFESSSSSPSESSSSNSRYKQRMCYGWQVTQTNCVQSFLFIEPTKAWCFINNQARKKVMRLHLRFPDPLAFVRSVFPLSSVDPEWPRQEKPLVAHPPRTLGTPTLMMSSSPYHIFPSRLSHLQPSLA